MGKRAWHQVDARQGKMARIHRVRFLRDWTAAALAARRAGLRTSAMATVGLWLGACGLLLDLPDPSDALEQQVGLGGGGAAPDKVTDEEVVVSQGGAPQPDVMIAVAGAFMVDDSVPVDDDGCVSACDCDGDGVDGPGCGGDDCDDNDGRVFPGQTQFFAARAPNDAIGFDYDCSGKLERQPNRNQVASCAVLQLTGCGDEQGYDGSLPACGAAGKWVSCQVKGLSCVAVTDDEALVALCH